MGAGLDTSSSTKEEATSSHFIVPVEQGLRLRPSSSLSFKRGVANLDREARQRHVDKLDDIVIIPVDASDCFELYVHILKELKLLNFRKKRRYGL